MDAILQEFSYLETLTSYLFCISLILLFLVPFLIERLMKNPKKQPQSSSLVSLPYPASSSSSTS